MASIRRQADGDDYEQAEDALKFRARCGRLLLLGKTFEHHRVTGRKSAQIRYFGEMLRHCQATAGTVFVSTRPLSVPLNELCTTAAPISPSRKSNQKAAWRPMRVSVNCSTPTAYFHSHTMLPIGTMSSQAVGILDPDWFISFFVFTYQTSE